MAPSRRPLLVTPRPRAGRVVPAMWLALALGTPAAASAQSALSVEVTPLRVELKVAATATHTQAITLRNDSHETVRVRVRVDDYWLSRDGTPQFKLASSAEPYSAAAWVRANPSDLTLKPGATATVRATTTVPAGVKDGGYRCAVMFEFEPPGLDPKAARKDMLFRGRVATIVYATVGNPASAVELTDLQAQVGRGGIPDIVATLTNAGRAYVRTKGTLVIRSSSGGVVRELSLPNVPILPESTRELRVPTGGPDDTALQPGRYTVEMRIDVGQSALLVGETTLEVSRVR